MLCACVCIVYISVCLCLCACDCVFVLCILVCGKESDSGGCRLTVYCFVCFYVYGSDKLFSHVQFFLAVFFSLVALPLHILMPRVKGTDLYSFLTHKRSCVVQCQTLSFRFSV